MNSTADWMIYLALALFAVASILVNPIGDFPLNDDWSFAISVRDWLETGTYRIIDWPTMSLFTHLLWGAIWCKVFGFSYTVLRLSTLVIAGVGAWFFAALLKQINMPAPQRLLFLLVLLFNPLYFHLSFSYMTDVPFCALCIIAVYYYWKMLQEDHWKWWLLATLFSILAILIRQLGLLLPLAFGAAYFWQARSWSRFARALIAVFLTFGSLQLYLWILHVTVGLPKTFVSVSSIFGRLSWNFLSHAANNYGGRFLYYMVLFILPVLSLSRFLRWTRASLILQSICLLLLSYFAYSYWPNPYLQNIIYNLGLGPITLPGPAASNLAQMQCLSQDFLLVIKVVVTVFLFSLSYFLAIGLRHIWKHALHLSPRSAMRFGSLLFTLAYGLYLLIDYHKFDRYLLPLLPMVLLLFPTIKVAWRSYRLGLAGLMVLLISFFSVAGTHDYLAWNRARWQALTYLESQGVENTQIDGGYEYNGWHQTSHRNPEHLHGKSWWFVADNEYCISTAGFQNYQQLQIFPYKTWLATQTDSIFALKRPGFARQDTFELAFDRAILSRPIGPQFNWQPDTIPDQLNELSFLMEEQTEFALTHHLEPVRPFEQFSVSFWLQGNHSNVSIVAQAPQADQYYYAQKPFRVEEVEGWKYVTMELTLPGDYPTGSMKIYLWKSTSELIRVKDWSLIWKRY